MITRHSSIYDFRVAGIAKKIFLLADYFTLLMADSLIKVSSRVGLPFSAKIIYNSPGIVPGEDKRPPRLPGVADDDLVILTVGQLKMEKGFGILREIALGLEKRPGLKFIVAGGGEDRDEILRLFGEFVKKGRFVFTGYAPDLGPYYSRASLFLLPSLREGFPLALLEAQAAGIPSIATDTGGAGEIIKDGENGFLLKPGETGVPAADFFIEKIETLLDDPVLRGKMAAAARAGSGRFGAARMAGEYGVAYEKVLKRKNLALSLQGAGNTLISFRAAAAYCGKHKGEVFDYCLYGFGMESFIEEFDFAGRTYAPGGKGVLKSLSSLAMLIKLMLSNYNKVWIVYPGGAKTRTLAKMFRYGEFLYRDFDKGGKNYYAANMEMLEADRTEAKPPKPAFAVYERPFMEKGTVGLHPGSGGGMAYKRWPLENYTLLVNSLISNGRKPLIFTGPQDEEVFQVFQNIQGAVSYHRLPLRELYQKLGSCEAFITGDTFLLHFAALCGVPRIIALYGPTDQAVTSPGPEIAAFSRRPGCLPCYTFADKGECPNDSRCLTDITPEEIIDNIFKRK